MEKRTLIPLIALSLVTLPFIAAAPAAASTTHVAGLYVVTDADALSVWQETNELDGLQQEPVLDADGAVLHPADEEVRLATTQNDSHDVCIPLPSPDAKGDREVCILVVSPPYLPDLPDEIHVCVPLPSDQGHPYPPFEETCIAVIYVPDVPPV